MCIQSVIVVDHCVTHFLKPAVPRTEKKSFVRLNKPKEI